MDVKNVAAYGAIASIYVARAGEGLPWHDHKHQETPHGHLVVAGSTLLEIEGRDPEIRRPSQGNVELAWDVRHKITALEDGTIFCNLAPASPQSETSPPAKSGGVMLVDGTIIGQE